MGAPPLPREHGAYSQLLLPLVVAWALASPTLAALGFTAAALAVFLAHEPLLIALGQRGPRAGRLRGRAAQGWLAVWTLTALAGIAVAASRADGATIVSIALPALLGAVASLLILRGAERTLAGELVIAGFLPALAFPVMMAQGVGLRAAGAAWVAWTLAGIGATAAVRAMIAHLKAPVGWSRRLALPFISWGTMGFVELAHAPHASLARAAVPVLLVASVVAAWPPHPRHLKKVGWLLLAASAATGLWLLALLDTHQVAGTISSSL